MLYSQLLRYEMLVSLPSLYLSVANAEPIRAIFSDRITKGLTFTCAFAVLERASECSRDTLRRFATIT